jgi:K+-sensing histidine kinase KdpD
MSADAHALVHDLRTPLAIVTGLAELLERDAARLDEAQRAEYLARIHDAAREMRDLLDAAAAAQGAATRDRGAV